MTYECFQEVSLRSDLASGAMKAGDVATIVEHHRVSGGEDGYTLELFSVTGETVAVVVVQESMLEPLPMNGAFSVRFTATDEETDDG